MSVRRAVVRHYGPGGREHGGGIGRLIGYISDEAANRNELHFVTDTRGPSLSLASPVYFALAMACMAADRVAAPERIHHIHVAGRGSTLRKIVLCAWARALGCAHVLHLHDYDYRADFEARPGWQRPLIRRTFKRADAVVVLGRADLQLAIERLEADPHRVVALHNAVPDPGTPRARSTQEPLLVFLGRLSERKGVPELLHALRTPTMEALRWRAVLAGDGPVEEYRKLAVELGLGDRVRMPGWLDQAATAELCRSADILVLPSHAEGMSMAILEGLAHGLVVVTTPVGSHLEAITDGETGVFVPVGDPQALAGCLAQVLSDPQLRRRVGEKARMHYLSEFSIAEYLRRLDPIYLAVAGSGDCGAAVERPRL